MHSRRIISATVVLTLLVGACGKKTTEPGATSGSGSSASGDPPTRPKIVVRRGRVVGTGDAMLTLPDGTDTSKITVTVKAPGNRPPYAQPYAKTTDTYYKTVKAIELGPDGTKLSAPASLDVTIDPAQIPAGASLKDAVAVMISADGTVEDVPLEVIGANQVRVEVRHFSFLGILFLVTSVGLITLGVGSVIVRMASDPMMRTDCASFLTPDSPGIAALATPDNFEYDPKTGAISITKTLTGRDVTVNLHGNTPDQVLARGSGDCVNMSNVMGSLFLARKHPVRLVAGAVVYERGDKTYKGFHQWAETVIDGRPYYVDTFEPLKMKLIPLDEASSSLKLERNKMCGKDPDGTEVGSVTYDPKWADKFTNELGTLETELAALKEKHRELTAKCSKEDSAAKVCIERKQTYDKAKALQEKINALKAAKK